MIWRGIIIIASHITCAILVLSGFHWLEQGIGLHPLIAFPSAIIIFCWSWLWISIEANRANVVLEDYLEWLDHQESLFESLYFYDAAPTSMVERNKAFLLMIRKAREKLQELAT